MGKSLDGVTVVVTRPAHQADALCYLIEAQGGTAVRFPVLAIEAPQDIDTLYDTIDRLKDFAIAIFISPNAVEWGIKFIRERISMPVDLKIAAVGQGTARRLAELDIPTDIFPIENFNSESLLEMEELQSLSGKQIVIFRGEGGRELLAQTLRERGATVTYAECYRRVRPATDNAELSMLLNQGKVDLVLATSNEGLQNLCDMLSRDDCTLLRKLPLIVVSDRSRQFAVELGFSNSIVVASRASDQALLEAMVTWKAATK